MNALRDDAEGDPRGPRHALDGALVFGKGVLPAWVFDVHTLRLLEVNEAAERVYGWKREEFLAMTLYDVRPPEEHARLRRYAEDLWRPARDRGPWCHWKKDGERMDVEVHTVDVTFGGRPCRLATMIDVTASQAMARELRESEARLRTVVEEMPVIFDALDEQGRIVFWNREAERVTGYTREEALADPAFLERLYPDAAYRERMLAEWRRRGAQYRGWEWTLRCKDGSERVVAWSSEADRVPLPGWAAWGVGVDVTPQRRAEARMEALSRRLLAAQEDERRAVSLELHDEIGQALTAVKLNLEALQRDAEGSAAAALADSVALVEGTIAEIRLLAYSLHPRVLDDLGLVHAIGWLAERARDRAGLEVRTEIEPLQDPVAPLVEAACFRIAQEALTNVLRHSEARRVMVALYSRPGSLVLRITDDGTGFDLAAIRARPHRGHGIGVQGMEERAVLAGGALEIRAVAGGGTEVCAMFPRTGRADR